MATVTVSKEDFAVVVASSRSIAECLDKLGMRKSGGSYRAFKNRTKKWSIDTSHFLSVDLWSSPCKGDALPKQANGLRSNVALFR